MAKTREPGRFVTLQSGRVIFIPEGKRTKWADVRDKIKAGREEAKPPMAVEGWDEIPTELRDKLLPGVTPKALGEAFELGSMEGHVRVIDAGGYIGIFAEWHDERNEFVGSCQRAIYRDEDDQIWLGEFFVLAPEFQDRGLAQKFYDRQIELAREIGCDRMEILADSTIGTYAWAKRGYEYADPGAAKFRAQVFERWAEERLIHPPFGGWPKFSSPRDFAVLKTNQTLYGDDISNKDVPSDMVLEVGKAFMLDANGHRAWGATLKL